MRTFTLISLLLLSMAIGNAHSDERAEAAIQTFADARVELQSIQEQILREEMRFTDAESEAFWPVYSDYQADLHEVRDEQAEIIANYLEAYWDGTISGDMADDFVDDYLEVKQDLVKVQRRHLKAFRRILPSLKVARLYQLETKLEADVNAQLALHVPLIETD